MYMFLVESSQKNQILLLQLGGVDISGLTSSHLSLYLRSLLTHVQTIYPEVKCFTKNGDKFGWIKYWQMTFNSAKFSLPQFYAMWYILVINNSVVTHSYLYCGVFKG